MTNHTTTRSNDAASEQRGEPACATKLRRVLRLNAASCVVSGAALTAVAGPIDDLLDTGHPGWVRVVGLGLLPFAAFCWWVSAGSIERLRKETPAIVAGDVAWVVASIVTVLLGWYSGGGVAVVLAMAVVVDVFAVLQFVAWRKLRPRPTR